MNENTSTCTECHRSITRVSFVGWVTTDDDDRRCYGDDLPLTKVGRIGHTPR